MLHFMRKHAKFFYIFLFLVIISFIFFYVGPVDRNQNPVVIEIGKDKIYLDEYWRVYDRLRDFYRDIYQDKFDADMEEKLNLKEKALETLLEERLLLIKARQIGLTVTDKELQDAIMHEPAFMRDGRFSKDIYLRTLQINRLTPRYYEEMKRRELLLKKIRSLIEESVTLTELDLKEFQGNQEFLKAIRDALLADKQNKTLRSYVETIKSELNVKVHSELLG